MNGVDDRSRGAIIIIHQLTLRTKITKYDQVRVNDNGPLNSV